VLRAASGIYGEEIGVRCGVSGVLWEDEEERSGETDDWFVNEVVRTRRSGVSACTSGKEKVSFK